MNILFVPHNKKEIRPAYISKYNHKCKNCHYTRKFSGAAHNICNLRYKVPKQIPVVFHNGSTSDYHFIIKQLAEDFKGQVEYLGENTEKYITFSVPIKEDDNSKKITYKLKFIDSYRFMQSKLSDLVDNLSDIDWSARETVNLSDLKMTDYIIDAMNVKKYMLSQKMD